MGGSEASLCFLKVWNRVRNRWYVANQSSHDKTPYRLWQELIGPYNY